MFDNIYPDISAIINRSKHKKREKEKQAELEELKSQYKRSSFFHELLNVIKRKDCSYIVWNINFYINGQMSVQWIKLDSNGFIEKIDERFTEYPDLTDTVIFADIGYESLPSYEHKHALSLAFQEELGDKYQCWSDEMSSWYEGVHLKELPPSRKPTGLKPTL